MDTRTSLRENKLFRGLEPGVIDEITNIPRLLELGPETVIFDEGQPGDEMYLVLRGTVRISKLGRGGQQEILSRLVRGDYFGEMALFDDEPRSARATTLEPTVLGAIDRSGLHELLRHAPGQLQFNLTAETIRRLRNAERLLIDELLTAERLSVVGSMAAMVIHDLKNPLAVIKGATEMLAESSGGATSASVPALITRAVESMLVMMQDLLDFSRGNTALCIEPVSIAWLQSQLEDQSFRWLANAGITVEREILAHGTINADARRLMRALLNIIRNAGEVMVGGGTLRFRVERVEGWATFTISDTGPGIPDEILPRIFEPFVSRGKATGTGLGLAIAKAAVDAHHGTISVVTRKGEGTTFTLKLPDAR